jgi:predicted DNA-binding transcriptional regulator AlpA
MGNEDSDWLRSDELAVYVRRSIWTIYDWRKRKVGPRPQKIGGLLMYPKDVVHDWIDDGGRLEPWDQQ